MGADWWRLAFDVFWAAVTMVTAISVGLLARIKASGTRIEQVERHLTSEIHGMGDRVTRLEEQIKILPSAEDVARIGIAVEGLRADVNNLSGNLGERIDSVKELIGRTEHTTRLLEQYLLNAGK